MNLTLTARLWTVCARRRTLQGGRCLGRITRRCSSRSGVWTGQRDWGGMCITLLLSYMYFGARMAQATRRHTVVEAEAVNVMRMPTGERCAADATGETGESNARLWRVVCRSAATVDECHGGQSRLLHSLMRLRHRSASLASEVEV
ncbi:hypothetical protein TcBrA4_0139170 [Trypanosoma cruzi]|nr:hypothetical protein TcBrA4_0139170 [Trypanosoma cruzi]